MREMEKCEPEIPHRKPQCEPFFIGDQTEHLRTMVPGTMYLAPTRILTKKDGTTTTTTHKKIQACCTQDFQVTDNLFDMNALMKPTMIRMTAFAARRMMGTVAKSPLDLAPKPKFRQIWLSDQATYPLIGIMACAMMFMTGMGINGLANYKDVRIDKKKRTTMMRNWGEEETKGVVQTLVHDRVQRIKQDRALRRTPDLASE